GPLLIASSVHKRVAIARAVDARVLAKSDVIQQSLPAPCPLDLRQLNLQLTSLNLTSNRKVPHLGESLVRPGRSIRTCTARCQSQQMGLHSPKYERAIFFEARQKQRAM